MEDTDLSGSDLERGERERDGDKTLVLHTDFDVFVHLTLDPRLATLLFALLHQACVLLLW